MRTRSIGWVVDQTSLKAAISAALDAAASELTAFGDYVFEHAELGFREDSATLIIR